MSKNKTCVVSVSDFDDRKNKTKQKTNKQTNKKQTKKKKKKKKKKTHTQKHNGLWFGWVTTHHVVTVSELDEWKHKALFWVNKVYYFGIKSNIISANKGQRQYDDKNNNNNNDNDNNENIKYWF